jgi:hypothetical protein
MHAGSKESMHNIIAHELQGAAELEKKGADALELEDSIRGCSK